MFPKIYFNPVQAGSGDPSPSNVRAISGWSQVNGYRTGENLFGGLPLAQAFSSAVDYSLDTETKTFTYTRSGGTIPTIKYKPNTRYTVLLMSYQAASGNQSLRVKYTDGTSENLNITATTKTAYIFTTAANKTVDYFDLIWSTTGKVTVYYEESGIFEGVITASDFTPYTGNTYPISLGSTYYGGYVDTQRGKIVVTHLCDTITGGCKTNTANYCVYELGALNYVVDDVGISNVLKLYIGSMGNMPSGNCAVYNSSAFNKSIVAIRFAEADSATTATQRRDLTNAYLADLNTNGTPMQLAFKLATPLEYDLASIPNITSLLGINNVWADSGDVEVTIPCDVASLDGNAKILPAQKTATIKEYSSAHTITKDDYSCLLLVTGATTITLPACDIGTEIEIMRYGTSTVTISPSGVTINGSSSNQTITTQYVSKKLKCISATAWVMT